MQQQLTLLEAFGLTIPAVSVAWVDPGLTAAILAEWHRMGCPADLWPLTLYRDGVDPVEFTGPGELGAATLSDLPG